MRKNEERVKLHTLQYESVEIQDDNKQKDNKQIDDEDGNAGVTENKAIPKKINMEKIAETIVGLKTYEVKIGKEDMQKYMEFSEGHQNPKINIWNFVCAIVLLMLNLYGKQVKNDQLGEYAVRKIVESFYFMRPVEPSPTDLIQNGILGI